MSGEQPRFNDETKNDGPKELQLAFLQDTGLTRDPIKTFETIPKNNMLPAEIISGGKTEKAYFPANPPEPNYTVNKDEIQWLESSKLYAWQTQGKLENGSNCQVTIYWKPGDKPGELKLHQMRTTYTNDNPSAPKQGVDIPLMGSNAARMSNVKRDIRTPSSDPARQGFDCVMESYPIKANDGSGDYLVYINKSFESIKGPVENKTVENVLDTNYDYLYRTRVKHYASVSADGKIPIGLKSDIFYADPDGGTTKKLREIKYTDGNGKPTADGKPVSTIIYDTKASSETPIQTVDHKEVKGSTEIAKITHHNYRGVPNAKYVEEFTPDGQMWKTRTYIRPNGTTGSRLVNDFDDGKQLTLNLYGTLNLGEKERNGNGTFVYKLNEKGSYDLQSLTITDASGKPITSIVPQNGRIKPIFNAAGRLTGLEGGTFYKNGKPMSSEEVANIFAGNDEIHKAWQDDLFKKSAAKK